MKIYVASKFENKPAVRTAMVLLQSAGHSITHDWTVHEDGERGGEELLAFFRLCAQQDFDGVVNADAILVLNHELGKGMFTEMGIAQALGKPVVVVDISRSNNIFFYLPGVKVCESVIDAISYLGYIDLDHNGGRVMGICHEVFEERARQDKKWGKQNHPNGTGPEFERDAKFFQGVCDSAHQRKENTWLNILREEVYEAFAELDVIKLRKELIQVAAVAVSWVGAIDRRLRRGSR